MNKWKIGILYFLLCSNIIAEASDRELALTYWRHANGAFFSNDYRSAIAIYTLAIDFFEKDGSHPFFIYYARGKAHLANENFLDAIEDFTIMINQHERLVKSTRDCDAVLKALWARYSVYALLNQKEKMLSDFHAIHKLEKFSKSKKFNQSDRIMDLQIVAVSYIPLVIEESV